MKEVLAARAAAAKGAPVAPKAPSNKYGFDQLGIETAKLSATTPKLLPGEYVVSIKRCLVMATQKAGNAFIAEFDILEGTAGGNQAGTVSSFFQSLSNKTIAGPNLLGFMCACLGVEASDEAAVEAIAPDVVAALTEAVDTGNLEGTVIRVFAQAKTSQGGNDYTRMNFAPYVEEAAA